MLKAAIMSSPIRPDILALEPSGLARIFELGGGVPGQAFGTDPREESYVRICFGRDADNLAEGLGRIAKGVAAT
jgi:hypothetical protein